MELDTGRDLFRVSRKFHFPSLFMPVRATEDNMRKVFRLILTAHTELADMKSTVSANFMPHSTK
eukprot:5100978-Amphidinium_carterae.1